MASTSRPAAGAAHTWADPFAGALATLFAGWARLRHDKPIHTRGALYTARIRRGGAPRAFATPWLAEAGEEHGIGRLSRGLGTPWPVPDVLGFALRFPGPNGQPCDLLMSTTGQAPVTRHLMMPRVDPRRAVYTTLTAYRAGRDAVLLAALPDRITNAGASGGSPLRFVLAAATLSSRWTPFGTVDLIPPGPVPIDPPITFDPARHPLPGLRLPEPVARIRAVTYAAARAARSAPLDTRTTTYPADQGVAR